MPYSIVSSKLLAQTQYFFKYNQKTLNPLYNFNNYNNYYNNKLLHYAVLKIAKC